MSVDLTDVLELTTAPPMGIDPYAVLTSGRCRVRRRRVTGFATSVCRRRRPRFRRRRRRPPRSSSDASGSVQDHDRAQCGPAARRANEIEYLQTGTDGEIRRYRFVASPNVALGRNEGRLFVLDASGAATRLGAVALSYPERGPVEGAGAVPGRGLVWGVGPASGNTRANYTLSDGTSFSVPVRPFEGTPWEVSVIDGLTPAQQAQGGSATDDRGVPVLR